MRLIVTQGKWVSEARLEKPEHIMTKYLETAIKELAKKSNRHNIAGRVYHEFAVFCDQQLNDPNAIEDYNRAARLRERKQAEFKEADKLARQSNAESKHPGIQRHRQQVEKWLKLDEVEFSRLKENREAFMEKSIANYLRCLHACDDYDQDAMRFCALWLQHSQSKKANAATAEVINKVESRKFVPLINQLTSRLLDRDDEFQNLLFTLIFRICSDHPYHGIYQVFALTLAEPRDETAKSRKMGATDIMKDIKDRGDHITKIMMGIYKAVTVYMKIARIKIVVDKRKPGKVPFRKAFPSDTSLTRCLEKDIPNLQLPPPTMDIKIRRDQDYSNVAALTRFDPELAVATGLSAPKVLTCIDSTGKRYKMLVKGGNDDLRQDAIMEQVFGQVSDLLQRNRQTRQRNLVVRTYKVIPLNKNTGIIEFVPDTIPLHEWLIPAHALYHPKDHTSDQCRNMISQVQQKSREERVRAFNNVMKRYTPVMRYFFLHNFEGPDDWFRSRLAYTRSTAAISILGWVLGLGDRHGHNILLDKKSGEVVHIDLGVAFEQGRILPIPEVVPFRLTRDVVDGMGITGTEGVFRRCCEFTLTVLRHEKHSITTILDVLRYDPLYAWTISPVRMQRMQANTYDDKGKVDDAGDLFANQSGTEEAEAERALEVVAKKLTQTLSVEATVNELIQQATDVRNLALLYQGWGAYA